MLKIALFKDECVTKRGWYSVAKKKIIRFFFKSPHLISGSR